MLQEAQAVGEGLGDEMLCRERRMEKHHCTKHVSKEAIVGADPPAPAKPSGEWIPGRHQGCNLNWSR